VEYFLNLWWWRTIIRRNQQGSIWLGLEFYRLYLPFLKLICFKQLVEVLLLSGVYLPFLLLICFKQLTEVLVLSWIYSPFFSWYVSSNLSKFLYLVGCTFPFFSWCASSNWWRFQYLVVPLPPYGLPRLGWMLAWIWSLSLVYFSLPCLGACFLLFLALCWVLFFNEVWQCFITIGISGLYI